MSRDDEMDIVEMAGDGIDNVLVDEVVEWLMSQALAAARLSEARLQVLNTTRDSEGAPELLQGIALNVGHVLYGNIGVAERLQFTVTGRAVNAVARLEALTKSLDRPILASRLRRSGAGPLALPRPPRPAGRTGAAGSAGSG